MSRDYFPSIRAALFSLIVLVLAAPSQARFSWSWNEAPENLTVVGAEGDEIEYTITHLPVIGGLFFPGEPVTLSLARPAQPKRSAEGGSIEAVAFNTGHFEAGENGFVHPPKPRSIERTPGVAVAETKLSSLKVEGDAWTGTISVPEAFGMYALVLKRADGTRTALGSVARVPTPQPRVGPYRQIMGEWGLPGGTRYDPLHSPDQTAKALARAGIGLVRREIQSGLAKPGDADNAAGEGLDSFFVAARDAGILVMITAGTHQDPDLQQAGASVTRQLPPSYDPGLTQWFAQFARRHWTGGESGLWAMEHFNEPWEPEGISGWNSDSQRYRQLLKCLYDGAKSVDKRIKIVGTSSVMNTEDKLLSGDSREHMEMLDVLSDHYVSLCSAYGPRVAEKYGIISAETEGWGAHSQVLVGQFMTQFLSNGQKWINPAHESMLWHYAPGRDAPEGAPNAPRAVTPTSATVGLAVWNAIIQDREFKRLVFTTHLPYLYQFGDDNDARFMLYGKVVSINSSRIHDNPWWQVVSGPSGTFRLPDPQRSVEVRDLNGNPLPREADGSYTLILDTRGYYLSSPAGAGAVADAVRAGTIVGFRAVHIAPSALSGIEVGSTLTVTLHNALNRAVTGKFVATGLNDKAKLSFTKTVEISAGEILSVEIPLTSGIFGGLPVRFEFTPDGEGLASTEWTEVVQPTVISRLVAAPDAKVWAALPGATVLRPEGMIEGSEIEAIWLPFVKQEQITIGTRRGELKLAYDEKGLHVYAVIDADKIRPRPRLATRNDDAYFWSDAYAEKLFGALRPHLKFLNLDGQKRLWGGDRHWVKASGEPGWQEFQDFLASQPKLKELVDSGKAKRWAQTLSKPSASFDTFNHAYLPGGNNFPQELPYEGDALQFAIDVDSAAEVMTKTHDLTYPATGLPAMWVSVPDSDYEFSLYQTDDGKAELWCLMGPGVPRGHYFPRQERGKVNQHAVKAESSVENKDGRTTYRASIPWSVLGGKPWPAGSDVGFTFRFNASDRGVIQFGEGSGATKSNSLTLHPYWTPSPSNSIRWTIMP